jgi:hypothetical protein
LPTRAAHGRAAERGGDLGNISARLLIILDEPLGDIPAGSTSGNITARLQGPHAANRLMP